MSSSCAKLLRKLMAYIYESEQVFSSNSSLKPISVTVGGVLCGGPLMMSLLVLDSVAFLEMKRLSMLAS